jgi:peroxiredoxin
MIVLIRNIYKYIKDIDIMDSELTRSVFKFASKIQIMSLLNNPAPDFTLYNTAKEAVTLSSLKGKNVLLLFIPFAFTGTCTKELCSVRDDISYYDNMNAVVFGISVDSPFALGKFREEQKLNMELLSDFNKTVSAAYNSLYEVFGGMKLEGVSKRSAFVIDSNGIVRYEEILDNAGDIPDFVKIKACLDSLK